MKIITQFVSLTTLQWKVQSNTQMFPYIPLRCHRKPLAIPKSTSTFKKKIQILPVAAKQPQNELERKSKHELFSHFAVTWLGHGRGGQLTKAAIDSSCLSLRSAIARSLESRRCKD